MEKPMVPSEPGNLIRIRSQDLMAELTRNLKPLEVALWVRDPMSSLVILNMDDLRNLPGPTKHVCDGYTMYKFTYTTAVASLGQGGQIQGLSVQDFPWVVLVT